MATETRAQRQSATTDDFDIILAADMTRGGDRAYRIAEEVRHWAARGRRVALVQAVEPGPDERIAPEVHACVRRGLATVAGHAGPVRTALLVVHGPATLDPRGERIVAVTARRTVLVCHTPADLRVDPGPWRRRAVRPCDFAVVEPALRRQAPPHLRLLGADWMPPPFEGGSASALPGRPPAVGWLAGAGDPLPPPAPDGVGVFTLRLDGTGEDEAPLGTFTRHGCPSLDRLADLDALVFAPVDGEGEVPWTAILAAATHGRPVVLSRALEPRVGRGPVYCDPAEALATAVRLIADQCAGDAAIAAGRKAALRRSRPLPLPGAGRAAPAPIVREAPRPVLFLPSNGVGVGHVSRLLALARRLDPATPILFASQAQAIAAIERFGFRAEYIPSATYLGGRFEPWDAWFRHDLEQILDAYDPALVVYDGNHPSDGLVRAVASRRDCRLAWVRRGLWGDTTSRFLPNARWCDLVVEPGELEGQPDAGVTAERRAEATVVPPVTLLDDHDLLPRAEAARALGLDPARPAVLVHLGAGYNRDIVSLIDNLVAVLKRTPDLQICVAEWVNGAHGLGYWPGVTVLRGFPLSQYFRAFDFSIAAAGYNSFHEVVAFGLPTIFIPNRHPSMDDQAARADLAQDRHAAFVMEEDDLEDLPELVRILTDRKARGFLGENCRTIRRANGAEAAARHLMDMVGGGA